jgi:hypothetical protein
VITVRGSEALRAAALALRAADRDLRNDINRATRATLGPVWTGELARRSRTRMDTLVLARGARIAPGNPPVAIAANSGRKLRGGLIPRESWAGFELGARQDRKTTYTRSTPSGTTTVRRHTTRQLPPVERKGRVVWASLRGVAPRAVSLWVQIIVRKYNEAAERGGQ